MHTLTLTSDAYMQQAINSFEFCNSEELQSIITSIGEELISGTLQLEENNSIVFVNVKPETLHDAYRTYGSKFSEAHKDEKAIQFAKKVQFKDI